MAYTTLAQLNDRYGERLVIELTDRDEAPTGVTDTDTVDQAIEGAAAQINGYLQGRYALPLAETPPLIKDLAEAIAIYRLHIYSASDKIEAEHKAAVAALRDIGNGTIRLPIAGVEPKGSGGTGVRITDRERPLTAQNLKGFI
ncbi:gp436 family protein [Parasedimentitalea huanghaiensis]|uniref:DUF1320 domain-containing protein n=1 Tax=Parasedimentitalea huanghaiensis TaxID=2682100 RepID=A0A6L6WHR3_9RHOB|nr:DUF1320 domain-containing protein [Zongyanglinia huanghaiensis]MVO16851.1 DUF1320 domain-containing protein [Zongyanglinia huanghaiensis]